MNSTSRVVVVSLLLISISRVTLEEQMEILCTADTLSQPRGKLAATSYLNKVYFAGGQSPTGVSTRVDILDTVTGKWTTAELSAQKSGLSADVIGSTVVFGSGVESTTVDVYDTATNSWSNFSSPVNAPACTTSIQDYYIITGGNSAHIYNFKTKTWTTRTLKGNGQGACTSIGNKVLLSSRGAAVVDVYDVKENSWTTNELFGPTDPYEISACTAHNMVLFVGMSEIMNVYNARNNTWTTTPSPVQRIHFSAASFEDRYCMFAGGMSPLHSGKTYSQIDIYDTVTNRWTTNHFDERKALLAATSMGTSTYFGGGMTLWDTPQAATAKVNIFKTITFHLSLHNVTAYLGDSVTFNVTHVNGMNYEWRKNNVVWMWSNTSILTTRPLVANDDQSYYQVIFSDQCGNKYESNVVFITVAQRDSTPYSKDIPQGAPQAADEPLSFGLMIMLGAGVATILALVAYFIYRWRRRKSSVLSAQEDEASLLDEIMIEPKEILNEAHNQTVIPFDEIKIGDKLGEGSYGEVLYGKWHNQTVALKKLKSSSHYNSDKTDALLAEAKTLKSVHHKHIVLLFGVTQNPETNEMLLVMEYMRHGSLSRLLFVDKVVLAMPAIIRIALDVANGVDFLHHLTPKIIHRDLKSENVLLYRNKMRAKISDFGTARLLHDQSVASTVVGTLGYIAPEILQQQNYDEKVDIFSFGVLLYELCTNTQMPVIFEEDTRLQKVHATLANTPLRELILTCCKNDSAERPTMTECIEKLRELKRKEPLD